MKQRLSGQADIISCTERRYFYIVLSYDREMPRFIEEKIRETFAVTKNLVSVHKDLSVTLGLGRMHKTIAHLKDAMREAKRATFFRLTNGVNCIIRHEDVANLPLHFSQASSDRLLHDIRHSFHVFDEAEARRILDVFFSEGAGNSIELMELLFEIEQLLFDPDLIPRTIDLEVSETQRQELHACFENSISLVRLKANTERMIAEILAYRSGVGSDNDSKPIRDALHFIHTNYAEPLSLEMVAEVAALHPVYFSNLFKKKTGETFVNYLNRCRVEESKAFLTQSSETVAEVAYRVGIRDPKYFSRLFKKFVGMSPLDYRSIYG